MVVRIVTMATMVNGRKWVGTRTVRKGVGTQTVRIGEMMAEVGFLVVLYGGPVAASCGGHHLALLPGPRAVVCASPN